MRGDQGGGIEKEGKRERGKEGKRERGKEGKIQ